MKHLVQIHEHTRLTLALVLLWMAAAIHAQVNPRPGYIIGLQGDTIQGTIDYRSDGRNCKECMFQPAGSSTYKAYTPQEISGYRFADNGIYYVTRTFMIDGVSQTFFAEFLLQGGISLYHYKSDGQGAMDYYFLVDQNGEVALLKGEEFVTSYWAQDNRQNKRELLKDAAHMLSKSQEAQTRRDKLTSANLTRIVKRYDEQYCADSGDCVQFQYSEKATALAVTRFFIQAGVFFGQFHLRELSGYRPMKFSTTVPKLGVGLDMKVPRMGKNLSFQADLLISKWDMTDHLFTQQQEYHLEYICPQLDLGATYSFLQDKAVSPFVRAGATAELLASIKEENMATFQFGSMDETSSGYGFFVGAGADFKLDQFIVRAWANYEQTHVGIVGGHTNGFSINAAFIF